MSVLDIIIFIMIIKSLFISRSSCFPKIPKSQQQHKKDNYLSDIYLESAEWPTMAPDSGWLREKADLNLLVRLLQRGLPKLYRKVCLDPSACLLKTTRREDFAFPNHAEVQRTKIFLCFDHKQ